MKLMEKMKKAKRDNKGFSLVELIIVIAIMAILVGIVGTQVVPYLSKSKVAKDQQVLNSVNTAAVTAYSENADEITTTTTITIDDVFAASITDADQKLLADEIKKLTGFADLTAFKAALSSNGSEDIEKVSIEYNFSTHIITTSVVYTSAPTYPIENVTGTL